MPKKKNKAKKRKQSLKKRKATIKKHGSRGPKKAKKTPKTKKQDVIGVVTHYFPKVKVAVIQLKRTLHVGDAVLVRGRTSKFKQIIKSMQIDHRPIKLAKKGDEVGLRVKERVRVHDVLLHAEMGVIDSLMSRLPFG
jgi:translation elongation factor EF-1alpha